MGSGEWGVGNGEWGVGSGEWGMGSGEWGMGNGEWRMESGEWEVGVRLWLGGWGVLQSLAGAGRYGSILLALWLVCAQAVRTISIN
jgi:hypothetical protein